MSDKLINFLSSFGIMIIGVVLLFFGSISFSINPVQRFTGNFPLSEQRILDDNKPAAVKVLPTSRKIVPLPKNSAVFEGELSAPTVIVVDDKTNTVLFAKQTKEVRSLASITKLMSALVLLDQPLSWASTTVIAASDIDSSNHNIFLGEIYSLDALWRIALVGSSNSAIHALVRASGLTEAVFVERMNAKADEFGLRSLRFVEPTGLDDRNMGTAQDVARLLSKALAKEKIARTLGITEVDAHPIGTKTVHKIWSTNWLLTKWIPHIFTIVVGKTGFIEEAGYNFTALIHDKEGRSIRVVVLGANNGEARFTEARDIALWVFNHYVWPEDLAYKKM